MTQHPQHVRHGDRFSVARRGLLHAVVLTVGVFGFAAFGHGAEIVRLSAENWDRYAPEGKEVDAIHGDFVLRNDRLVAVIGQPASWRNANMTTHGAAGALIDMTRRDRPADQLTALFPAPRQHDLRIAEARRDRNGAAVLICRNHPERGEPIVEVRYILPDGSDALRVETRIHNTTDEPVSLALHDDIRADRTFTHRQPVDGSLAWIYDEAFGQAYGFVPADTGTVMNLEKPGRAYRLQYALGAENEVTVKPGEELTLGRRIYCAAHPLALRSMVRADAAGEAAELPARVTVTDPDGPVSGAKVTVKRNGTTYATGRSDGRGRVRFTLPEGTYKATVDAIGRPPRTVELSGGHEASDTVELEAPGYAEARITDADGEPIPCKVQFVGLDDTENPHFGPDSAARGVRNVRYSHDGHFRQALAPGRYRVIASRGPEYDAVFETIEVNRGSKTRVEATLRRTVNTAGWVSSDFHSHSSPSGDNTSSQLGRVLNLLAEHVEFAPCTEHNRLSSYVPHLKRLGVEHEMATCVGIELTGSPGSTNHQNAFPLVRKPGTQDGGAPQAAADPVTQISRLALWDGASDKLVQQNHPNIVKLLWDGNLDGEADGAHAGTLPYMDVIEVHPAHRILDGPAVKKGKDTGDNRMHSWLLMLNQGHRVPGVINTDAHYNFHGSGGRRNYIKSPTDDPAEIDPLDMVEAAQAGHLVMSNGPFLEVRLTAAGNDGAEASAIPGDEIAAPDGRAELHVRVQCSNWLDIDRVQVLVNGRADPELNLTREDHPGRFGDEDEVVKFDQRLPVKLDADAHLIVIAVGEHERLGPVMGSRAGRKPIAVSNPIYVDAGGDGFTPADDTLGSPAPIE